MWPGHRRLGNDRKGTKRESSPRRSSGVFHHRVSIPAMQPKRRDGEDRCEQWRAQGIVGKACKERVGHDS